MSKSKSIKIEKFDYVVWTNEKGKLHREDGPAIVWTTGTSAWYINDKMHRLDGPAIVSLNGVVTWCINNRTIEIY
jgi:hypothetical protein